MVGVPIAGREVRPFIGRRVRHASATLTPRARPADATQPYTMTVLALGASLHGIMMRFYM